jgi:hypothetical protein
MPDSDDKAPSAVERILFKEIVAGDLRKFEARSNDADTGGGARDLRFGDYGNIQPIVELLFPERLSIDRTRNRQRTTVVVFAGQFVWEQGDKRYSRRVQFEPPTTARPTEGRITKVHEQPSLDPSAILPLKANDRVFLLFVQRDDGGVWPYFTTESSLRTPDVWDQRVAKEILRCMDRRRAGNTVVIGYRDFISGDGYCNGR